MKQKLLVAVACFLALFWLWPNLVHEPMHIVALKIQGSDGYINFDLGYPSAPTTTRTVPIQSIAGGMLFLLLPSVLNIVIVAIAFATRHKATLLSHVVLPTYLVTDLFINASRHTHQTSDFYFLTVLNPWIGWTISVAILVLGFGAVYAIIASMSKQNNLKILKEGKTHVQETEQET